MPVYKGFSTKNIHIGNKPEFPIGAINPPIYASSTFVFPSVESGAKRFSHKEYGMIYSRLQNPTVENLEKKLATLEKADAAIGTASGMSAITTTLLHLLKSGDRVVAHNTLYGGSFYFLANIVTHLGIEVEFVDFTDLNNLEEALEKKTNVIYFETPTNPLLQVIDIAAVSDLGKRNNSIIILDNTFSPPFIQTPLTLGVDIVIHSLTKYINGHSDLIAGAIIGSANLIDEIRWHTHMMLGGTMSPFTAFLISRGIATLELRLEKHCNNAREIARFLQNHSKIEKVFYPGLPSHEGYNIAKKQMHRGFGGMISFILKGGFESGKNLIEKVKLPKVAVSLGGVESLIEHPASMTHSEYSRREREKAGIFDGLVRFSVGLEELEDLIADLEQALQKI